MKMSPSELQDFKNLINPLKRQQKIGIYYSPINVLELIKGMKLEEYFEKCQEEIRLAYRITDTHFIESPFDHVKRSAAWFIGLSFNDPDPVFLNLCKKIAISSSYQEIKPEIQPFRDMLNKWSEDWASDLNSLILSLREKFSLEGGNKNWSTHIKEFLEKETTLKRKQKTWVAFCRHFSLSAQLRDLPLYLAYNRFHSFRYWVDYRLTYENKMLFENRKAKPSDYLDWIQIVYLNEMDYLITEDNKFKEIFRKCENEEINGIAISFDEFVNYLKGELPPKRAPDTTSEQWINTN
ncbi:MAG: hypothetical protein MUO78_06005 [candidate division Zixibacteria bacterium]|nr:hypothetical protein [candidate division Zixibacteria bacterium]